MSAAVLCEDRPGHTAIGGHAKEAQPKRAQADDGFSPIP